MLAAPSRNPSCPPHQSSQTSERNSISITQLLRKIVIFISQVILSFKTRKGEVYLPSAAQHLAADPVSGCRGLNE